MPLLADINLNVDLSAGHFGSSQRAGLVLFACLLGSFLFIRTSSRLIRSPRFTWWPGSVKTKGGLHVHHLVFGIIAMMLSGFLGFALAPSSPWIEILAGVFGIGAGLTLDEYALWLRLEDVYWSDQGRSSVDAAILAVTFTGLIVVGLSPFDVSGAGSFTAVAIPIALHQLTVILTFIKGKVATGFVGLFFPPLAVVGAIRLGRPSSPWARWRYDGKERKLARARERDVRFEARRNRLTDLIGGAPTRP